MIGYNNIYLAKSNPRETIQEHTDKLLENLRILKLRYPSLFLSWDIEEMLRLACLYHDLGKMNVSFQKLITTGKGKQEVPHAIYSLCFLDAKNLTKNISKKYLSESKNEKEAQKKAIEFVKILSYAIAYHHERDIPSNSFEIIEKELDSLKEQAENFKYDKVGNLVPKKIVKNFFSIGTRIGESNQSDLEYETKNKVFQRYILIKGLLNRIDYASSAGIEVERENNFLQNKLEEMMSEWKKKNSKAKWNRLQEYMITKRDENVITVAQTGMGKTEAGLLWIGDGKGFFVLPLKTAINAIYKRVKEGIVKDGIENKVGLLHSETRDIYLEEYSGNDLFSYYENTRQLSLPLTICTLDQIFDFVYRHKGFEPKLATLSYSKIVLDEIQMYSPDLLAYVVRGLKYITKLGGKFAILTATFPRLVEDLLKREGISFEVSENFIKEDLTIRHNVEIHQNLIDSEFIISKFSENKVLVICNTVKEAQRLYDEVSKKISEEKVNLLHSRFIKKDRKIKEDLILNLGNKDCKDSGIWITTQVVEASLDIDFDILITELSDLNGLFQRMGRCFRNRKLLEDRANCYVFVGEDKKKNTGVKYVIDEVIYDKSRELLLKKVGGKITEEEKMSYVEELYTTENLKDTNYYKRIFETFNYLDITSAYEKDKKQVQQEFRNISSYTVIPKSVYQENKAEIDRSLDILKSEESSYTQKIAAKLEIKSFTLSIQDYDFKKVFKPKNVTTYLNDLESIELSKYEKIYLVDGKYSFEKGFSTEIEEFEEKIEDRFL